MGTNHPVRAGWALATLLLTFALGALAQDHGYPPGGAGGVPLIDPPKVPASAGWAASADTVQNVESLRQATSVRRLLNRVSHTPVRGRGADAAALWLAEPEAEGASAEAEAGVSLGELNLRDTDPAGADLGGSLRDSHLSLSIPLGNRVTAGLGVAESHTLIRARGGWEVQTAGADSFVTVELATGLNAGLFGIARQADLVGTNDNGYDHVGGLSLSNTTSWGPLDLSLTAALAKTLQDIAVREHDTVFYALADLRAWWTRWLASSVYLFFQDSLRRDLAMDRTFCTTGLDLDLMPTDRFTVSLGAESALAAGDYDDYRLHAGVLVRW